MLTTVGLFVSEYHIKHIEFFFHQMGSTTIKMHQTFFDRGSAPDPAGDRTTL